MTLSRCSVLLWRAIPALIAAGCAAPTDAPVPASVPRARSALSELAPSRSLATDTDLSASSVSDDAGLRPSASAAASTLGPDSSPRVAAATLPVRCHADSACGSALVLDRHGNQYIATRLHGELVVDPQTTIAVEGRAELVIIKLSPRGEALWVQRFDAGDCLGIGALAVAGGDLVLTGAFTQRLQLGALTLQGPASTRDAAIQAGFIAAFSSYDGRPLHAQVLAEGTSVGCGGSLAGQADGTATVLLPVDGRTRLTPELEAQRGADRGFELVRVVFDTAGGGAATPQITQSMIAGPPSPYDPSDQTIDACKPSTVPGGVPVGAVAWADVCTKSLASLADVPHAMVSDCCYHTGTGDTQDGWTYACIVAFWDHMNCSCGNVDLCQPGAKQQPSTCALVAHVCEQDPWCCTQSWDAICVDEHVSWNGAYCPGSCAF